MEENVKINCPSCGGSVSQEDARDGICTCPFCNNTFYVKDIINQPKVTINNTVITNHYGSEHESLSEMAKDVAISYADAFKETARFAFSPRAIIGGIISTILCIVFLIVGFFVYQYSMDRSLSSLDKPYNVQAASEEEKTVDLRKRIYIVLADGSSQINGEATIAYNWYDDDDKYKDIALHAEPSTNLSNGDIVKISISDKGSHDDTEFEPEEWEYVVNLMLMDEMN